MRYLFAVLLLLASAPLCLAATIHVPADQPTIQAGINAASNGDVVLVASGIYSGPGNRVISLGGKSITLTSQFGADSTIIDCEFQDRAFVMNETYEPNSAKIDGFTITHGYADEWESWGGGFGGAVYLNYASPTFQNCVFISNQSRGGDGAVVYCNHASPLILDCVFADNWVTNAGHAGAIYCDYYTTLIVRRCAFSNNNGNMSGGALTAHNNNNLVVIDSCTFVGNYVWNGGSSGGALSFYCAGSISNSTFIENSAPLGGAICGRFQVINCTFVGNSASDGSVLTITNSSSVTNCLLAYNTDGGPVHVLDGDVVLSCTDVFGNSMGDWIDDIAEQQGINGNFSLTPVFCDTSANDFHLHSSSPCVPTNNDCDTLVGSLGIGCSTNIVDASFGLDESLQNIINHTPVLYWDYYDDLLLPQSFYEVEFGIDNDWSDAELWATGELSGDDTSIVYDGAQLEDGQTYWFRVRASNGVFWSLWCERQFRMNTPPTLPTLYSPSDGSILTVTNPELVLSNSFDEEGDGILYSFALSPDSFVSTNYEFTVSETEGATTAVTVDSTLQENGKYWWYARASDGFEESDYSDIWTFYVDGENSLPSSFQLKAPPDGPGAAVETLTPEFLWLSSSDPDPLDSVLYSLQVAIDSNFIFVSQFDSIAEPPIIYPASLSWGTRYWWKIKAEDTHDGVTWSDNVLSFRTVTLGDANADGITNITDAVFLISYIFSGGSAPSPLWAGDANCDGLTNITDAVYLISYIFSGGPPPCGP